MKEVPAILGQSYQEFHLCASCQGGSWTFGETLVIEEVSFRVENGKYGIATWIFGHSPGRGIITLFIQLYIFGNVFFSPKGYKGIKYCTICKVAYRRKCSALKLILFTPSTFIIFKCCKDLCTWFQANALLVQFVAWCAWFKSFEIRFQRGILPKV